MSKNILYICPSSGLGGAETFIKTTFLEHKNPSLRPVYLLFRSGPLLDWLKEKNANVIWIDSAPRISNPLSWLRFHSQLVNIIHQHHIHLVHSTMAYGALFSAWACKQTSIPHIWFQHGPASGWMDQLAAIFPHQVILTNSRFTLNKQLALEKPISFFISKQREVIQLDLGIRHKGVDEEDSKKFRAALLKKHKLTEDTLLIAMACRLQKWKGVHLLLQALPQLKNKNHHVFIWGDTFDSLNYVKELHRLAKDLPVTFPGATSNISLAFSACDIVINASIQPEPFGLTLIEAMAAHCTVIAPNEGGPSEFIQHQENGLLFEARSSADLAKQMDLFIENRELLRRCKVAANQTFLARFQSSDMVNQLENIYFKTI